MTKAKKKVAGNGVSGDIHRITLESGFWVEVSTGMTGRDVLTLLELSDIDRADKAALLRRYPDVLAIVDRHVADHNLPLPAGIRGDRRDILLQKQSTISEIFIAWRTLRDSEALPKEPETESA